jgi:lysine 6-dehydrogenase
MAEKLLQPEIRDIVVMRVEASGVKSGKKTKFLYDMVDRYDEKHGVTAMARTTGYPVSIVAQMMLMKKVKEKGVVAPERLGKIDGFFKAFCDELRNRRIMINEVYTNA